MGIYKYENTNYDIYEKENLLSGYEKAVSIPSKSVYKFNRNKEIGYCGVLLYKVHILDGLKHSVQDYNYKSLVVMQVKETYEDSDGEKHTLNKLINLGGYVKEKNKDVEVKHISMCLAGHLISVEGRIINNSNFTIKVEELGLYRSMQYANANVVNDIINIDRTSPYVDDKDPDIGEYETVFYIPTYPGSYSVRKAGNSEDFGLNYWNTNSRWLFVWAVGYDAADFWPQDYRFTVFDDKGNKVAGPNINPAIFPDYTEYLAICPSNWESIDESGLNSYGVSTSAYQDVGFVFYMNNLQRKYAGEANKYHKVWKEGVISSYENKEGKVLCNNWDNSYGNTVAKKLWDNEKDNAKCITFQVIVQPDYIGQDGYVHNYYCSTQPFTCGGHKAIPVKTDEGLLWFVFIGADADVLGQVDVVYTKRSIYDPLYLYDRCKLLIEDAIKLVDYGQALEDKYPDGDKTA